MATNHFFTKLCLFIVFLSFVSAAFPLERTKSLKKIRAVNAEGPYYGLITSSPRVEQEFFDTVDFVPNKNTPYVDLAGRRFQVGVVEGKNVIVVKTGGGLVNAAQTTQQLLDYFDVYGVINFGTSGGTNNSLKIGDVVVPKEFVNTGLLDWLNPNADVSSNEVANLGIEDYNVPQGGSNLLGRIGYRPETFYSESGEPGNGVEKLWFQVNDMYLRIASNLKDAIVRYKMPNIVTEVKGSTADIYVNNAAYREFLYQTFHVSSVDTESAAIVMTCLSNGNPRVIVFRGVSNFAGAEDKSKVDDVLSAKRTLQGKNASKNVARAVAQFIRALPIVLQQYAES